MKKLALLGFFSTAALSMQESNIKELSLKAEYQTQASLHPYPKEISLVQSLENDLNDLSKETVQRLLTLGSKYPTILKMQDNEEIFNLAFTIKAVEKKIDKN